MTSIYVYDTLSMYVITEGKVFPCDSYPEIIETLTTLLDVILLTQPCTVRLFMTRGESWVEEGLHLYHEYRLQNYPQSYRVTVTKEIT